MPQTALVVDDNQDVTQILGASLRSAGFDALAPARDRRTALVAVEEAKPDLVLVDIHLGDEDGIDLARHLRIVVPSATIVLISVSDPDDYGTQIASAIEAGSVDEFVSKADLTSERLQQLSSRAGHATSLVLADDNALMRVGLREILSARGFTVVGEADDHDSLVAAIDRLVPDVAIIDIRMPPTFTDEGIRAADHLAISHPGVGVLVLSSYLYSGYARRLFASRAPGRGYLLKDSVAEVEVVVDAVRRVRRGECVLDREVVTAALQRKDAAVREELSSRESEVLGLMAQGRSNRGIASSLFLSERTVESHVRTVMRKLGIPETEDDHRRVLAVLAYLETPSEAHEQHAPAEL